ncbi:tRNA1(Val) (adenine(37)-N6)-methyltransferase [Undibacter mobilis]|uniref:Methyltransferase n=1 Tax=Undibacter mobilis TaxID=2292256 RepID=A0A371B3Y7_9BRAD|nr:methyltransferase [Undibacter mobilis]RDV02315.1 methyltransferase [Undibacter mobilis]
MIAGIDTTDDAVLGGRLRLLQPKRGHRVGHDAMLLAAATGGRAGERAVDFGAGIGGAGLALAWRVPGLRVTLLEIDPALAALAGENARRNGMGDRVDAIACDVESIAALAAAGLQEASADQLLMNPPFNDPATQQSSPDARRRLAHVADADLLRRWLASAAWTLKPGGTLTLIWRAAALDEVIAAVSPAFGEIKVLRVAPRPGAEAIRILMRAVKGGTGRLPDLPPLILNDDAGKPSGAAEAVLREAKPLALADRSG